MFDILTRSFLSLVHFINIISVYTAQDITGSGDKMVVDWLAKSTGVDLLKLLEGKSKILGAKGVKSGKCTIYVLDCLGGARSGCTPPPKYTPMAKR